MNRLPLSVIGLVIFDLTLLFENIFYPIAAAALAGSIGLFVALYSCVVWALRAKELTSSEVLARSQVIFAASLVAMFPVLAVRCFIELGWWDFRCVVGLHAGIIGSVWEGAWNLLLWWAIMTGAAFGDMFFIMQRKAG